MKMLFPLGKKVARRLQLVYDLTKDIGSFVFLAKFQLLIIKLIKSKNNKFLSFVGN